MADLPVRDLALNCRGGPWAKVPDITRCPACLGALPPDVRGACSTCGTGTPRTPQVLSVGPHDAVVERDETGRWTSARTVDEEHTLTEEEAAALLPTRVRDVASEGRRAWWQRFARWPNA